MSMMRCETHGILYDSDFHEKCCVCETCEDIERFGIAPRTASHSVPDVSRHGLQRGTDSRVDRADRDRVPAA